MTPVQSFKRGNLKAAIWQNTGQNGSYYSVTIVRPYKDAQGQWKNATSYGLNDLVDVEDLAKEAHDWIVAQEGG